MLKALIGFSLRYASLVVLAAVFVAVVMGVVFITLGQRRIPTQSAKHVRGRRVYGGTRQYLPLRVNQAGVMPIIFGSSLLIFPSAAMDSIRLTGTSDDSLKGSPKTVKNMARAATPIKR